MAGKGGRRDGHRALPLACRLSRWILAAVIVAGWLGLYGYWLASDSQPDCRVSTTTQAGEPATITRTCGLPDVSGYLYVAAVVALLLLPDAKAIAFGGFRWERSDDAAPVAQMVGQAVAGDVLRRFLVGDDAG
jgi:hypothetical protein